MTTQTISRPTTMAARNERLARRLINTAITAEQPLTTAAARLIAATIHTGPYTALERFARCGALEGDRALDELHHLTDDGLRRHWRQALATFITAEARRGGV